MRVLFASPGPRRTVGSGAGERGLSFAELIVGMAIAATLAAAALPAAGRLLRGSTFRGAALGVYGELQEARMEAAATGDRVSVRISADGRSYGIYRDANRDRVFVDAELEATRHVADSTAALQLSGADVVFSPNGTTGASGTLTLTDPVLGTKRIVVSPAGRVRIETGVSS